MTFLMTKDLQLLNPQQLEAIVEEIRSKYRKSFTRPRTPEWITVPTKGRVFRSNQIYCARYSHETTGVVVYSVDSFTPDAHPYYMLDSEISYIDQWLRLLCPGAVVLTITDALSRWIRVDADEKYNVHVLLVVLHYILIGPQNAC